MKYLYGSTRIYILIIILTASAFMGCAPVKLVPVWRPWTRSIGNANDITPGNFTISCEGTESALVGSTDATETVLSDLTSSMLERRGFVANNDHQIYQVRVTFRTNERDAVVSNTFVQSRSSSSSLMAARSAAGAAASRGSALGIAIASLVGGSAAASSTSVAQSTDTETRYHHALSVEILDMQGRSMWKGDAAWWSRNLDILDAALLPLQILIADLPATNTVKPHVSRVKHDRISTFFRLYCLNRWFSSPAVPYRIRFDVNSSKVNNQETFMAYLDVLERSEQVVPIGENHYEDVTDRDLWDELLIGGEYLLGPIREPVKVLVTLERNAQGGYDVERAKVATDSEYQQFLSRMERWHSALKEYYNIFD